MNPIITRNREQAAKSCAAYYAANREKLLAKRAAYRAANPDKVKACKALYRAANKERITDKNKKYYEVKKEQVKEQQSKYRAENKYQLAANCAKWRAENPDKVKSGIAAWKATNKDKVTALSNKRRAKKLNATPDWSEAELIQQMYAIAKIYTDAMGNAYHVDHIVPLQSKKVCGLHVIANLEVIPGKDNLRKGNRIWKDMP